jgi:hypothetical protein
VEAALSGLYRLLSLNPAQHHRITAVRWQYFDFMRILDLADFGSLLDFRIQRT